KMVFLGLCMAITALPVSVRILIDLGRLQTNIGQRIVTVAVQDDTTALLLLGMILGIKAQGGLAVPILITGLKTAVFFATVLLVPVFFAAIGVEFQLSALASVTLVVSVLIAAFVTKIFGGYIGGRLAGLTSSESWVMGFGMNGRGVMELVIADLALKRGFISTDLFSTLVLMGMVTTMLTPTLLKWSCERAEALAAAEVAPAVAAPAMAAAFQPDVPEDLITNLPYRRAWARNASGTESDAGAGSRLFRRARGVDRRLRPDRRQAEQRTSDGKVA